MMSLLKAYVTKRDILRTMVRKLIWRFKIGGAEFAILHGSYPRPNYGHLVYQAAKQAHLLGRNRVSILEFGVAGGNGLIALEQFAELVETIFPVKIEIYGFDTGEGLPPPEDYRDLPYQWDESFFKMDPPKLEAKLARAKIVYGNVRDTVDSFFDEYDVAPVGGVSHDLDYYSSTRDGFQLFDAAPERFLPRFHIYFDDCLGSDTELYNDFIGERLAIHEFNANHEHFKISPAYYLQAGATERWRHQIWTAHISNHPDYTRFIADADQQLALD